MFVVEELPRVMPDTVALAETVVRLATVLGVRVAAAESLTGGMLASAIVSVPGASLVLSGGIVAYDTELKQSLLGVDAALLRARGPVDGDVARQMAVGVRDACAVRAAGAAAPTPADIGVATTGVAGPTADPQTGQPAGTVWLGVSSARGERARRLDLGEQTRGEVRAASVVGALELVLEELRELREARGV